MDYDQNNKAVPIWEKYALTIDEASQYFNIGSKKIRKIIDDSVGTENDFSLFNGTKCLVKREMFEGFLNKISAI